MEENKEKFDYKTLPLNAQYVYRLCKQIIKDLKAGNCSEEQINDFIAKSEPRGLGYYREDDFVSVDEGMRILRLGKNRNLFFQLIKKYDIKANTFKGVKIGYKRDEIYKLNEQLDEEYKKNKGSK